MDAPTNGEDNLLAERKSNLPTTYETKAAATENERFMGEVKAQLPTSAKAIERADLLPERTITTKEIQKIDDLESLSSCLCVMDDNHRLVEWIAYHYFVMRLRYLVILPDPKSVIMPKPVLDKWRKYMTIVEWKDADYMTEQQYNASLSVRNMTEPPKKLAQQHHNLRQNNFLKKCAVHMKENNRTWVGFTDVDEYYVINHELIAKSSQLMEEPGGGFKVLHEMNKLLESLHRMANLTITDRFLGPCITTYRTLFGAVESKKNKIRRSVPSFLDPRRFETLRWRYHKSPKIKAQDGKSMLDVSRIPLATLESEASFTRPHALLPECPSIYYHGNAFVRINHYLGNFEYYSFRANDPRKGAKKNRRMWNSQSNQTDQSNGDEIRPWISGFVRYFGVEEAKHLLDGCGLDPNYTAPLDDAWLLPRDRKAPTKKD
jgi:hypothetical protein